MFQQKASQSTCSVSVSARSNSPYKRLVGVLVAGLVILLACAFELRYQVVRAFAPLLVRVDSPRPSDLIYLLGGNCFLRAPLAAKLYREGWAPKVLVSREPTLHGKENFTDVSVHLLMQNGVPSRKIVEISPGSGVRSTADEARALRVYLDAYPAQQILVVTSMFHSRRARLAIDRALWNRSVSVSVVAVEEPDWTTKTWQNTAFGRRQVALEELKLVGYWLTMF